jgi:hypothetical protein
VTDVTLLDTFQVQQAPLDPAERNRDVYIGRRQRDFFVIRAMRQPSARLSQNLGILRAQNSRSPQPIYVFVFTLN